jgi:hypothetical protein
MSSFRWVAGSVLSVLAFSTPSLDAQQTAPVPRPVTITDAFSFRDLHDPQISPDGKWAGPTPQPRPSPDAPTNQNAPHGLDGRPLLVENGEREADKQNQQEIRLEVQRRHAMSNRTEGRSRTQSRDYR